MTSRRRKSSHCVPESWSLRGIEAQRNMTEQVGFHKVSEDHPPLLPNAVLFYSPSLNRAFTFPCKMQVSLIMPNTNFNECLHHSSKVLCFWAKGCVATVGPVCNFCCIFYSIFMVTSFALLTSIRPL